MSDIIELDTVQTDSNTICKYNALYFPRHKCINFYILVVVSVQSNGDELIDMDTSLADRNLISKSRFKCSFFCSMLFH